MPTVKFLGRYENLSRIREFVAAVARKAGLDRGAVYAVQLAVDEACSNIIEHAYAGKKNGHIECTCLGSDEGVTVILRDWGRAFDPNTVPEPKIGVPIEELTPRGAGLYLIRNLMDEVRFEFSEKDGNTLTMVKRK